MAEKKSIQKQESQAIEQSERIRSGKVFLPATDIIETDNEIIIRADMPGVNEKAIDITLDNKVLTIQGCVDQDTPGDYQLAYSEYETGDYLRKFTLSDAIEQEKINARYKEGVLEVTLPKAEKMKARQITVTSE
ncbi:Hsp20/alpha crystallin family protein [bacterium]|nr:Hsp20/alpha crystallin family protein [bacterium]